MIQRDGGEKEAGRRLEEQALLYGLHRLTVLEEIPIGRLEDSGEACELIGVSQDHKVEQDVDKSQTKVDWRLEEEEEAHNTNDHLQGTVDSEDIDKICIPFPGANVSTKREGNDTKEGRDNDSKQENESHFQNSAQSGAEMRRGEGRRRGREEEGEGGWSLTE
jgi:hypothetical protein